MTLRQVTSISGDASSLVSRPVRPPCTLSLWLAAGLFVGTGGIANIDTLSCIPQTGTALVVRFGSGSTRGHTEDRFQLPQEQMAGIRRYLSLNISEIAQVLRVRRPTVYAWLNGDVEPRSSHLDRIAKIFRIAREWRSMSTVPVGGMLRTRFSDSTTLLDLLSAEMIDEAGIRQALGKVRAAIERAPIRRSVAEAAKAQGIQLRTRNRKWTADEQFNM